ncbi:uncharacterized protein P174DRAFT_457272 [Aspergillus novofumigatus IBT 16806]|uniref:Uncharacterized protein n=1 Tax=Aspergillus novofumigatus (strain IBT 16806) TaxID=1392255 RepID=A0A2I1CFT4_ASPN1|nr:uncharacterized protein P174DRAFT_457272 [Aspergillus novofumigatus IBT 16806]PKX96489.1 hypothetical protein P174DRAFT_457272 [Aspergillus novofumigatus IBT 16806]
MDSLFPYALRRKMTMLVCSTLTDEYKLDLGAKTQPPVNINDPLFSTYHPMAVSKVQFTMDVKLYIVKHPEDPNYQMLLMQVKHRLNKGRRNQVYTYTKQNDNLSLCVIQDILEYAFLNNTLPLYTHVPAHQLSTLIHFKESMKEIPIFHHPVKDSEGSRSAGAAANLRHLNEHSQNIIIGHKRSSTFAYYVQLTTNLSLTHDASIPQDLSNQQKQELKKNPNLTNLYREFQKAKHKVRVERKKLHKAAKEKQYKESFKGIRNHIIKGNYQGQLITFKLDTLYIVLERRALADLKFKNRDMYKVNDTKLVEDQI